MPFQKQNKKGAYFLTSKHLRSQNQLCLIFQSLSKSFDEMSIVHVHYIVNTFFPRKIVFIDFAEFSNALFCFFYYSRLSLCTILHILLILNLSSVGKNTYYPKTLSSIIAIFMFLIRIKTYGITCFNLISFSRNF